ncbi:RHO protein GDP dissociation inhibitor domain-containing protein [Rhizoctonia solani AG-1 IA]|uniref:RHO protein GDP dissociation inhibitor domain-containing protein n=1 Tax=Thanatephorus cucumeris (strain AG1-IA) TaxID=983506 RepID=L8X3I7_THACA|nr:RHO protein GDP dissociation inhibitor domain-containing protein [Rhizoctonia solani AG-1 IA]
MSPQEYDEDLNPTTTAGYKVTAKKTVDEYGAHCDAFAANLDANDESLVRWKASLGIGAGGAPGAEAKFIIKELFLKSDTLPPGKTVSLNLADKEAMEAAKKKPITIKEGIDYSVGLKFEIENDVISGLRYLHVVKRAGIKGELEQMIGSFGPKEGEHSVNFVTEESPSGIIARSGTYDVVSRITDDDGHVHAGRLLMVLQTCQGMVNGPCGVILVYRACFLYSGQYFHNPPCHDEIMTNVSTVVINSSTVGQYRIVREQ